MDNYPERYFNDTNFFFKVLRTINLLEPGRAVVSLSKLFFLLMMFTMVWITVNSPEHIVALLASVGGTALALLNYIKRRSDNMELGIGVGEIPPTPVEEEAICEEEEPVLD